MRYINGGNVEILRDRILNESVNLINLSPQLQVGAHSDTIMAGQDETVKILAIRSSTSYRSWFKSYGGPLISSSYCIIYQDTYAL